MLQSVRRVAVFALGAGALAAGFTAAPAFGDAPPNCSAADMAGIASGVSAATSAYLFTHPDVNAFFSGLAGQPREGVKASVHGYMDANPQVKADLTGIRQPLTDFRSRCGLPGHGMS